MNPGDTKVPSVVGSSRPIGRDTFFSLYWQDSTEHTRCFLCALAGLSSAVIPVLLWDEIKPADRDKLRAELLSMLDAHERHRCETLVRIVR